MSRSALVAGSQTRRQQEKCLGSWRTEIGTLGRLMILRSFETADVLAAERKPRSAERKTRSTVAEY